MIKQEYTFCVANLCANFNIAREHDNFKGCDHYSFTVTRLWKVFIKWYLKYGVWYTLCWWVSVCSKLKLKKNEKCKVAKSQHWCSTSNKCVACWTPFITCAKYIYLCIFCICFLLYLCVWHCCVYLQTIGVLRPNEGRQLVLEECGTWRLWGVDSGAVHLFVFPVVCAVAFVFLLPRCLVYWIFRTWFDITPFSDCVELYYF